MGWLGKTILLSNHICHLSPDASLLFVSSKLRWLLSGHFEIFWGDPYGRGTQQAQSWVKKCRSEAKEPCQLGPYYTRIPFS
jgi:hypothetical protein